MTAWMDPGVLLMTDAAVASTSDSGAPKLGARSKRTNGGETFSSESLLGGDLGNRCLRLSLVGCSCSPKTSAIWSVHLADSWRQVATTGTTTQHRLLSQGARNRL